MSDLLSDALFLSFSLSVSSHWLMNSSAASGPVALLLSYNSKEPNSSNFLLKAGGLPVASRGAAKHHGRGLLTAFHECLDVCELLLWIAYIGWGRI